MAVYDIDSTFLLATRRNDVPFVQLEEVRSVERNCSCLADSTKELLVAQAEGVFGYSVAEQGSAIGIEGNKSYILSVGLNVMLISNEEEAAIVRIYDFKRRHICYDAHLQGVAVILALQDDSPVHGPLIALFLSDGRIHRVQQLSPEAIMNFLCEAELFDEGLRFAAENQYPPRLLRQLYKFYGDSLYRNHRPESALDKYISAMGDGSCDPSCIIERFVQEDHSHLLVKYLLAMAEAGHAHKEHIRLLLHRLTQNPSCFLLEIDRLVKWIQSQSRCKTYISELRNLVRSLTAADQKEHAKTIAASCHLVEEMLALQMSENSFDCQNLALEIVSCSDLISTARLQNLLLQYAKTMEMANTDDLVTLLILLTKSGPLTIPQCIQVLRSCASETRKMYLLNVSPICSDEVALSLLEALLQERKRLELEKASSGDIEQLIFQHLQRQIFMAEGIALSAVSILRDGDFGKGIPIVLKNAFPASKSLLIHAISLTGDVRGLVTLAREGRFQRREYRALIESAIELIFKSEATTNDTSNWDPVREIVQIAISRNALDPSEVCKLLDDGIT